MVCEWLVGCSLLRNVVPLLVYFDRVIGCDLITYFETFLNGNEHIDEHKVIIYKFVNKRLQ